MGDMRIQATPSAPKAELLGPTSRILLRKFVVVHDDEVRQAACCVGSCGKQMLRRRSSLIRQTLVDMSA